MAALVDTVPVVPLCQTCRQDSLASEAPSIEQTDAAGVIVTFAALPQQFRR
jgi:hypothetical protein